MRLQDLGLRGHPHPIHLTTLKQARGPAPPPLLQTKTKPPRTTAPPTRNLSRQIVQVKDDGTGTSGNERGRSQRRRKQLKVYFLRHKFKSLGLELCFFRLNILHDLSSFLKRCLKRYRVLSVLAVLELGVFGVQGVLWQRVRGFLTVARRII